VNVLFVEVDGQLSGSGYLPLTSTTTTMTDAQSAQVRWLLDPDPVVVRCRARQLAVRCAIDPSTWAGDVGGPAGVRPSILLLKSPPAKLGGSGELAG